MAKRRPKKNDYVPFIAQLRRNISMLRMYEEERHRRETLQREREKRYRRFAELSPDAIIIHRDGRIIFANSACARMLKAETAGELLGKDVFDFLHPDIENIVKESDRQMIEEGIHVSWIREHVVRTDGSLLEGEIVATPFYCDGSSAIQVIIREVSGNGSTGLKVAV